MSRWSILSLAAIPLLLSILLRPAPVPALTWWTTSGLDKVRPFDREPEGASRSAKISAARNEFEPFQIVLHADGRDISGVDIEVSDLRGKAGTLSAKKYITVYLERFLNLKLPSSITGGAGEWPDPLVPRVDRYANEKRNAFPFAVSNGRNQPIWIDVFVPPSMVPGIYHGDVRVLVDGKPQISIPLDLEVWNFKLPSTSSLATSFGFSGNTALSAHYGKYTSDKDLYTLNHQYQKAALWHRISIDGSAGLAPSVRTSGDLVQVNWNDYDTQTAPFMDGLAFLADEPLAGAKATSVALRTPPPLRTPAQQSHFWQQAARHFRDKGWFDRMFNYLWDEPKPANYPAMLELGRVVHRGDPSVKNLVTSPLHPDWSDVIDIWTPLINCFERKPHQSDFCTPMIDRDAYDAEVEKGKKLWWYQSCGSHGCFVVGGEYFRGWPSYMIDDAPVRNRIMEWLTWKYSIRGELYFSMNESYGKKKDPWSDVHLFGGNGDGTLFYPGRPDVVGGVTHIPIESIRLKLIREGLEDYEYLTILARQKGDGPVMEAINGLLRNTYDYDQDPKKLYAVRQWMGQEISGK